MFKLESYITPILLNYVDKYVKNVRAEQSQVSLWGGDAVFNNLDLRLDVLESELHLPLSLVSGHIHQLQIHVPWTRLHAEPIVITINTIECVLKLPTEDSDKSDTATTVDSSDAAASTIGVIGAKHRRGGSKRKKKSSSVPPTPEAPPGYVQSLVNKIISNVSIVCNNLILKYVEEDIVLSLNVRNLQLSSANELWEPAFTELSLPDLILRKLLKVTDVTVCLDRRNADGKIDTYQEPLLYRCSLSVHAAWCYDSLHSKVPSVSRYEIKCPKLDFSLTDSQIPMFLRIVNLLIALYYGEVVNKRRQRVDHDHDDAAASDAEHDDELGHGGHGGGEQQSWGGWAWNVGSSVGSALLPIYWEDEDADADAAGVPALDAKRDKVVHFGAFIDAASLVLKLTEQKSAEKSMFGSLKLCFTPFARVDCSGIFAEVIIKGLGLVNVAAGVSEIALSPLGRCLCGVADTKTPGESAMVAAEAERAYVELGEPNNGCKNYLAGSLFEKEFGCETGGAAKERCRSYAVDWESHMDSWTEARMLERSPALALDYMYVLAIPAEYTSEQLSELAFDLEYSNLSERALVRLVLGPSKVRWCSGFEHRLRTLLHFASLYDYPAYRIDDSADQVADSQQRHKQPATGDDDEEVQLLSDETPVRVYQLTAINPTLYIYASDHPAHVPLKSLHVERPSFPIRATSLDLLPGCLLRLECLDSQFSHAMYPQRLVHTAAQMASPPAQLVQKCQAVFTTKVMQMSMHLFYGDQTTTFIQPCSFQAGLKSLLLADAWKRHGSALPALLDKDFHFDMSAFKVRLTRPQTLALAHIVQSHLDRHPTPVKISDTTVMEDALTKRMSTIVCSLAGVRLQYALAKETKTFHAGIENFSMNMHVTGDLIDSPRILPILSRSPSSSSNGASGPPASLLGGASNKGHKSPMKNSPGRAQTRPEDAELLLNIVLQLPRDAAARQTQQQNSCLALLTGHVSHVDINVDPKLAEWYLYAPQTKATFTSASSTSVTPENTPKKQQRRPQREISIATSFTGPDVSNVSDPGESLVRRAKSVSPGVAVFNQATTNSDKALSRSRRPVSGAVAAAAGNSNSRWQSFLVSWYPTLNAMLIQFRMDGHQVFFPHRSLAGVAGKSVADTVHNSLASKKRSSYPLLGMALPGVVLDNVAHKPMIQQFLLGSFPVSLPDSVWSMQRDNLPWTLKLANFSVWSQIELVHESLLHAVSTSCTLSLTLKPEAASGHEPSLAVCVHTDMTPILMEVSEPQLKLLCAIAEDAMATMAKMRPELLRKKAAASANVADTTFTSTPFSPEGSSTGGISIPFGPKYEADSEVPTSQLLGDVVTDSRESDGSMQRGLSLWIQWTVPSISVSLRSRCPDPDSRRELKISLDMEDCQSSFDWTTVYFKMQSRILAANVRCFHRSAEEGAEAGGDWQLGANRGVVVSCADDLSHELHCVNPRTNSIEMLAHARKCDAPSAVFAFTFTWAESASVMRNWKKKKCSSLSSAEDAAAGHGTEAPPRRFISEIDVKLAPVDVILSPPDVIPFVKMLSHVINVQVPRALFAKEEGTAPPTAAQQMIGLGLNNNTLPLVYVKAKTIRVFLLSSEVDNYVADHVAVSPDFLLLQLDACDISPQVENPLTRIVVRPDLYHSATATLGVPGSEIEDRQYSVSLAGIGVFSGRWAHVLKKSEKPAKPVLRTMGENPALEWNTMAKTTQQQRQLASEVLLMPCLAKFHLLVTLAPAIVLMRPRGALSLVAGHAVEVNATDEIALYFSLSQLKLVSLLACECADSLMYVRSKFSSGQQHQHHQQTGSSSSSSLVGQQDSGVDCRAPSSQNTGSGRPSSRLHFVPIEVLVTGSNISCYFFRLCEEQRQATPRDQSMWRKYRYKHRRRNTSARQQRPPHQPFGAAEFGGEESSSCAADLKPSTPSSVSSLSYEASAEGSAEPAPETIKIYPLLMVRVAQPHAFVSCERSAQKLDVSFYDASVGLSPAADYFVTCGGKRLAEPHDFPVKWFQTRPGDANPLTGIPPALFTATLAGFLGGASSTAMTASVVIERPIKFEVGLELQAQFTANIGMIANAVQIDEIAAIVAGQTDAQAAEKAGRPTNSASAPCWITELRRQLGRFSQLRLSTKQVVVHFPVSSASTRVLGSVNAQCGLAGVEAQLKLQSKSSLLDAWTGQIGVDKLLIRLGIGGIFHPLLTPWSFVVRTNASWISNGALPIVSINLKSEFLGLKLGPNHLIALQCLAAEWRDRGDEQDENTELCDDDTRGENQLPEEEFAPDDSQRETSHEQHYMDDLRAGAFQFVTSSEAASPKPYQIVFSKKPAAMQWKYPQPRALTRVSVFPVPFIAASELHTQNNNNNNKSGVSCALQYWDACLESFQTYSEFALSEDNVTHLNLPTVGDKRRCAISATWRVLIDYDDDPDEDDEDGFQRVAAREIIVTPKALVSVTRVDSYFEASLIPRVQAAVHLPSLTLELYNQLHFSGRKLPKELQPFALNANFPLDQLFATLALDASLVGVDVWCGGGGGGRRSSGFADAQLRFRTSPHATYTDYAFLATHQLVYPTRVQGCLAYSESGSGSCVHATVSSRPVVVKYGHFSNHTLRVSAHLWAAVLSGDNDVVVTDPAAMHERVLEPLTHLVVCNNTQEALRFGQVDTDESQLLPTNEAVLYAWRSHKAKLQLRVGVEAAYWAWCEPFAPARQPGDGPVVRNIDHDGRKISLAISIEELRPTQLKVTVSGLLTVASMLKDHLELRVIHKVAQDGQVQHDPVPEQRSVLASFSSAPSFIIRGSNSNRNGRSNGNGAQCVKIRLLGIGTPWSGEIPLELSRVRKNKSVLVRIPTKEKGQCLTIWCRVLEEKLGASGPMRYLVLFSPMYMARSLLPNPMSVLVSAPHASEQQPAVRVELPGKEVAVQLETLGPSDQKYEVAFKVVDDLPASEPVAMSWGIIEQVRQRDDDEQAGEQQRLSIDQVVKQIPGLALSSNGSGRPRRRRRPMWPYIDREEEPLPKQMVWAANPQPKTDVQVRFTQFHPLCNTLCLEIGPWALLVNRSGLDLLLKDEYGLVSSLANDSVLVPPTLHNDFFLGIATSEDAACFSPALHLGEEREWRFRKLMPRVDGVIPREGVVRTKIALADERQVCFLTIAATTTEAGARVIHVKPTFKLCNNSARALRVAPLCVPHRRQDERIDATRLEFVSQAIPADAPDVAHKLLFWQTIGRAGDSDQLFDGFQHLSVSADDAGWAVPINLEDSRGSAEHDRKVSLFLPRHADRVRDGESSNIALLATLHQQRGQVFVVIVEDPNPPVVIRNNLEIPLRYGQSFRNYPVLFSVEDVFIHNQMQLLGPNQTCYFSLPWLQQNFPFKAGLMEMPGLALSASVASVDIGGDSDWEVVEGSNRWSNKIELSIQHEEFLNLPAYGDIKVCVERVGHSVTVFVDPVSKIEFSAKDIRSRLSSLDLSSPSTSPPSQPPMKASSPLSAEDDSFSTVVEESSVGSERSFVSIVSPMTSRAQRSRLPTRYHSVVDNEARSKSRAARQSPQMELVCALFVDEVSFALEDHCYTSLCEKEELVRVTVDSLSVCIRPELQFTEALRTLSGSVARYNRVTLCIGDIQIDNQMFSRHPFEFPLVLVGTGDDDDNESDADNKSRQKRQRWSAAKSGTELGLEEAKETALVTVQLRFDSNSRSRRQLLRSVHIRSRPMSAFVEDKFVYKLADIVKSFSTSGNGGDDDDDDEEEVVVLESAVPWEQPVPLAVRAASSNLVNELNLDEISIDSLSLSLSVHASVKMYLGLDQSPLSFSAFERANLLTTSYCLGQMLARHYISGALFRAGWVVGSLDLIGSPAGFTRTVGDGLRDFVALPYAGIFQGPWAFVGGVAHGSSSLLKHVSAGTLTSVTNFASSVSRNLDRLSLDQEHCRRNEVFRRDRPQGVGQGLANGLSGVGISLLGAIGGIAHHPISAVLERGMSPAGIVGGLTRGIVGVVTKPLGGAAELVAQAGQGLLHGTGWSRRLRPRYAAIPDHACTFASSGLKLAWKGESGAAAVSVAGHPMGPPCGSVIFMLEAIHAASSEPAALLLTQDALLVISSEEDAQKAAFGIGELDCVEDAADPTKLVLVLQPADDASSHSFDAKGIIKDRITQFVLEAGAHKHQHCTVSELGTETGPEDTADSSKESRQDVKLETKSRARIPPNADKDAINKEYEFYTSPLMRSAFLGMFQMVRRQMSRRGFDML